MPFLRDLLKLAPQAGEPEAVGQIREWLRGLDGQPPHRVVALLGGRIVPAIVAQANLHMRFKLLELARGEADKVLPELEQGIAGAGLPLPMEITTQAMALDNFLKGEAAAFAGIASAIHAQKQDAGLHHLLAQSLLRAMQSLLSRQMLAYRAYATPSPSSWAQLHELQSMGRSAGVLREGKELSPEQVYITALLMAYAEPARFPREELAPLHDCCARLATVLGLAEATPQGRDPKALAGLFLIRLEEASPGRPLLRTPENVSLFNALILDCRPAVDALERSLQGDPAQPPRLVLPVSASLRQALHKTLGDTMARRFNRVRFLPRADLVFGLADSVHFVAHRGPHGPAAGAVSEWALVNESPDGFGVRYVKGAQCQVQPGELVGLLPREQGGIHLCLVRRVTNSGRNRLELGLQELGAQPRLIELSAAPGPARHALLLPRLPAHGTAAGLIVPPSSVVQGGTLSAGAGRWRIERRLEGNDHLEVFLLLPIVG